MQSVAEWQKPCHKVVDTAKFVHDAVLSCCILTHLPPGRLSCMRSLQAPGSPLRCPHVDCIKAGCESNRLYVDSTSPLRMRMNYPHHKNEHKWKRAVTAFDVPADLVELLQLYLEGPRKVLLEYHLLIGDTCDTVFLDKMGRTFSSSSFTLYWQDYCCDSRAHQSHCLSAQSVSSFNVLIVICVHSRIRQLRCCLSAQLYDVNLATICQLSLIATCQQHFVRCQLSCSS